MPNRFSGFYKLTPKERLLIVAKEANLSSEEVDELYKTGSLDTDLAGKLVENVISTLEIPVGIVPNFIVNGKSYFVPMAIEEASVVAACSNSSRIANESGGFIAESSDPVMIGQIQLINVNDPERTIDDIQKEREEILNVANSRSRTLKKLNAGAKDIRTRVLNDPGRSVLLEIYVDVRDAMGANIINSMCESVASFLMGQFNIETNLRILSNLTPNRVTKSRAVFKSDMIGGSEVSKRIVKAFEMANVDPFRAATHNKGIMNGIDAVLLATLNDWRAAEANAHTYYHVSGNLSLSKYYLDDSENLVGEIEIPLAVGTVGGSTNSVRKAAIFRKILNIGDSREFSNVLASIGLAQNFAALRALCSEGIQEGHMRLHARSIAASVGATGEMIEAISKIMIEEKDISMSRAASLYDEMRKKN
ncbi:MAG: hydroxymethylglutaryl-CoA reductase, degradative [Candidatus Thermoplasmatota archaeon]|nr:hydroxymethylglutaryl-CoA reductase, degradative [Candidatus Thermoplasmatota archaeon]